MTKLRKAGEASAVGPATATFSEKAGNVAKHGSGTGLLADNLAHRRARRELRVIGQVSGENRAIGADQQFGLDRIGASQRIESGEVRGLHQCGGDPEQAAVIVDDGPAQGEMRRMVEVPVGDDPFRYTARHWASPPGR